MSRHIARRAWRSRALLALALLAGSAVCHDAAAQTSDTEPSLEHRVKAAFLYRFADYIHWPAGAFPRPATPFTIGVAGAETLAKELARVAKGRTVQNRPVAVKTVKPGESVDGLHMLFVGLEQRDRFREWMARIREKPILVVTEWEGAPAQGSMVNFVIVEGRVRFEIAPHTAREAGLALDSRLLTVAHRVLSGNP